MSGLLDYIFNNLDEKNLDRSQIIAYIRYLDELILDGLPLNQERAYQAIKLKLTKRLAELDHDQIKFYPTNTQD